MKVKFIDIDGTICYTEGVDYETAEPFPEIIKVVNSWYDQGDRIVYWSARGALLGRYWRPLTERQLKSWGCKYHELRLDKPFFDELYDDRAFSVIPLEGAK